MSERLINAAEIAERLGVPKTWVLGVRSLGAMPCVRLGPYVRFDLADVEAWLENGKQPGWPVVKRSGGGTR